MKNDFPLYLVIGTRAQFIKVAPFMREMMNQNIQYSLIYTAQHQESINEILEIYHLPAPNIVMYDRDEASTHRSFLSWFITILFRVLFRPRDYIPKPGLLLTHGDTFTAWMAALLGKRAGCKVGHIESGCRSYNLLRPFPEEVSRLLTFSMSDIYYCADEWAVLNLKRYRGEKINIGANTMLDGVRYALDQPYHLDAGFNDLPYVLVSIHRYENIFTPRLQHKIIPILRELAEKYHLVFTLHPSTRERLLALGIYDMLESHPRITLHERFSFVEWIHICSKAEFVITDGGSNQEELSYLGVPTLLFRNETERREGLGKNVVISNFDRKIIHHFVENLNLFRAAPDLVSAQPSLAIIQSLSEVM